MDYIHTFASIIYYNFKARYSVVVKLVINYYYTVELIFKFNDCLLPTIEPLFKNLLYIM